MAAPVRVVQISASSAFTPEGEIYSTVWALDNAGRVWFLTNPRLTIAGALATQQGKGWGWAILPDLPPFVQKPQQ